MMWRTSRFLCFYYMYIQKTTSVLPLSPLPCSHLLITFFLFITWVKLTSQENRQGSVTSQCRENWEALLCTSVFSTKSFPPFLTTNIYLIKTSSDFVHWNEWKTVHVDSAIAACLQSPSFSSYSQPVCFLIFYFSLFCQLPSFLKGGRTFWEVSSQVYQNQ